MTDDYKYMLLRRVFGGDWEGEDPVADPAGGTKITGKHFENVSAEAWVRLSSLTEESFQKVVNRAQRLSDQSWPPEFATELALGVITSVPEQCWPAKQRYMLANGKTREEIATDLQEWFFRNHEEAK